MRGLLGFMERWRVGSTRDVAGASELQLHNRLEMPGLLAFMERWSPGVTRDIAGASELQIAEFASPHGGVSALPGVYLEFLDHGGVDGWVASQGGQHLNLGPARGP